MINSRIFKTCNKSYSFFTVILFSLISVNTMAQTFPEGFTSVQVATGIIKPTAMTFAPDGRVFVCEQGGSVRLIKNGTLLPAPLIKLRVSLRGEGGLVGITLDPDFTNNQYLYLYYTLPDGSRNRISRFKCNGDVAPLTSETILLNLDTLTATIHNGGAMHFKDGKLFVSIGDNANSANAPDLNTYHGKVIRINADGSVPAGNPFTSGTEQKKRIWAYGLRNPFTFDIQPGTGKILVNDVGLDKWEEINDVTASGKNFGWPEAEGPGTNPSFSNPLYAYEHGRNDELGCAITGGTFFNPAQTNYPSLHTGRYFFQDYCGQWIKILSISGSTATAEPFATGIGDDALALTTGTDGNLYYIVRSTGSVYKIIFTTTDAPAIVTHPSPSTVSQGQAASFSVTATGKSPLNYQWQKNSVNIAGATAATYTIAQTTAGNAGNYRVRVFNSAGSVFSNAAKLTVTSFNAPPVAQIITPPAGALYRGGDIITFTGSATDKEDGELPAANFSWWVDFHHDIHHHDGPAVASGTRSGSFTIPTRGETSDNVWYRLYLIVNDSQGMKDTVHRDIYPHKSTIALVTQPAGMQTKWDGAAFNTPLSVVSVEKMERSIGAVSPQTFNGKNYLFDKWLHGGQETQIISTPTNDVTYTAVYRESASSNQIQYEIWNNIPGREISAIPVNSIPSSISDLSIFEAPANVGNEYGSRVRGFILAPSTGNYVFWISSDDRSELWLSTNDNPTNRKKIAYVSAYTNVRQWTKYPTQQSVPVSLVAGQRYYIEALLKEAAGADHIAVGWQLPDGTLERPVPGNRLSRYGNAVPVVSITNPANDENFVAPASINITTNASDADGSIVLVEFFIGTNKLSEDATAPYSFAWSNVAAGSYTVNVKAYDNAGGTATDDVSIIVTGMIQREVWTGLPGREIASIPLTSTPSSISDLTSFESPVNTGNEYGSRVRGFIIPPLSGSYVFWIASDDRSELWLSTDADPMNKIKIAYISAYTNVRQWTKYPTQQSVPMSLVAGQRYYIEALHKEAAGADHLAVGWQLPNGSFERPVTGNRLAPFETGMASSPASASALSQKINNSSEPDKEAISIFPNPSPLGTVTLSISLNDDFKDAGKAIVQIAAMSGKIVYRNEVTCTSNCNAFLIDIDQQLQAGIYVVNVTIGKRQFSKRLWVY